MNQYINYYLALGIPKIATKQEIKKAYYAISKELHPDKGGDPDEYQKVIEAYKVLSSDKRDEYDKISTHGNAYDENAGLYSDIEFANKADSFDRDKYNEFIKRDQLNIIVYFDNTFNGNVEYERWVYCKTCKGSGQDNTGKVAIGYNKDYSDGEGVETEIKYMDLSDDCEFCESSGKWGAVDCFFCRGSGKINAKPCLTCKGEKRYLGRQKLTGIVIEEGAKDHKISGMGNFSVDIPGKVGHLWLVRK